MMKFWFQVVCSMWILATHIMTLIWQIENNPTENELLDIFVAIILGMSVVLAWTFVWGGSVWN